jgi:hypothetical protein
MRTSGTISISFLAAFYLGCSARPANTSGSLLPTPGTGSMQNVQGGMKTAPSNVISPGTAGAGGGASSTAPQGAAGRAEQGPAPAPDGGHRIADATVGDGGAGSQRDAGPSADAGAVDSGGEVMASPPMFQKTRCIDPGMVEPGVEVDFPCDAVDLWVALPKQCTTRRCGLIFNIHGGGMTDHATMDQATNMISLGNRADYVVVHPHQGTGTWDTANDKVPMFDFLQQAIMAFGIDPKRVHSTGYSQGAQISWALGCEHADILASIAPAEEINRVSDCWQQGKLPSRELSILYAYGKQDTIGGGYDAATSLASGIASAWNMSGPETIAGAEGSNYWRQRWTTAKGTAFEFISHNYTSIGVGGILAGHCLPMSSGTTFVNCLTPVDYDWGQEVVRFFQAHPMQ